METKPMTPQERAAAIKHVVYMFGVPEYEVDGGEYENAIAATVTLQRDARRAALLEAKQVVSKIFDQGQWQQPDYYCALLDVSNEIDRLAQEG